MKKTILALGLIAVLLMVGKARADFLGLTPGDYGVTLDPISSSLCGGVACTGTIHIGSPDDTGFSWNFLIAGTTFDFTGPVHMTATGGQFDCAIEGPTGAECFTNGAWGMGAPGLVLQYNTLSGTPGEGLYSIATPGSPQIDFTWYAVPASVPEPNAALLILFGLSALGLRRLRSKQD